MHDILVNYVLPLLIYGFITGLANLALAHKSQIESWAETHPKYAGFLKLMRAVGFDPWNLVSAVSLWAKKRLPDAQQNGAKAVAQLKAESMRPPPLDESEITPVVKMTPLLLLAIGFAFHAQACASAPPKPPCDPTTLAVLTTECSAQAFECGRQGIPKTECPAIAECNAKLDARREACR